MSMLQVGPKTYISNLEPLYQIPASFLGSNYLVFLTQDVNGKILCVNTGGNGNYGIFYFDPYTGASGQCSTSFYGNAGWNGPGLDLLSTPSLVDGIDASTATRIASNLNNHQTNLTKQGLLWSIESGSSGMRFSPVIPWDYRNLENTQSVVVPGPDETFAGTAIDVGYNLKYTYIDDQMMDNQSQMFMSSPCWPSVYNFYPPSIGFATDGSGKFSISYSFLKTVFGNQISPCCYLDGYPYPMVGWGNLNSRGNAWTSYSYVSGASTLNGKTTFPGYLWKQQLHISTKIHNQWMENGYDMQNPMIPKKSGNNWLLPSQQQFQNPTYFPNPLADYPGNNCHIVYNYDILNDQPFPQSMRKFLVGGNYNNNTTSNYKNFNPSIMQTTPYYLWGSYAICSFNNGFSQIINSESNCANLDVTPQNLLLGDFFNETVYQFRTFLIPRVDYENGYRVYLNTPQKSPSGFSFKQADGYIPTQGISYVHIRKDGLIGVIALDVNQNIWYLTSEPPFFTQKMYVNNMTQPIRV